MTYWIVLGICLASGLAMPVWVTALSIRASKEGTGHTAFWYTIGGE